MIDCKFSDVTEHDMDMLFLEEFVSSKAFLDIFTKPIGISSAKVVSVQSSKTDVLLGESDMTITIEKDSERIGLLIENKIDAIAMHCQAERYFLRGEKSISAGEFDKYFVFIIAPREYMKNNSEAQKYPNKVEYESVLDYFKSLKEPRAEFNIQQINQAIEKQKKGYQVEIDVAVTEFWKKYSEYQKQFYSDLYFIYNYEAKGANATWPRFRTVVDGLYILHKAESGFVDLTIEGYADKIVDVEHMLDQTIENRLSEGLTVHKTGKSAAVRSLVPALDFHKPFDEQIKKINVCFSSIRKMSETAKLLSHSIF